MTHLKSLFKDYEGMSAAERVAHRSLSRGGISSVIWVVTERCNLKCIHCYEGGRNTPEISTEDAFRIIEKLNDAGKPLTFISGGEPLLRDDIMLILGKLKDLGFRVILSTNGTLVNEEVATKLADLGIDNVAIPLYGPQQFHDYFTGTPISHDRVIRALELLSDAGVSLTIKTVVARSVLRNLDYILEVASRFGAKAVYLCDFIPIGRGRLLKDEIVSRDEWRNLLNRFIDEMILGDKYPEIELDIGLHPSAAVYVMEELRRRGYDVSEAENKMKRRRLSVEGRGFVSISPTGDVLLINYLPIKLGNIVREDLRLEDVVKNPLYRAVGDSSMLKGRCGSCEYRELCGGSRVKAYVYGNDLLGEDPTCLKQ